jgi:hypothetical protein
MDVFVYSNVFALVGLLTMGTAALIIILIIQSLQLRDWRKRALIAESECKQMYSLYGPHHAKDISPNGKSFSL